MRCSGCACVASPISCITSLWAGEHGSGPDVRPVVAQESEGGRDGGRQPQGPAQGPAQRPGQGQGQGQGAFQRLRRENVPRQGPLEGVRQTARQTLLRLWATPQISRRLLLPPLTDTQKSEVLEVIPSAWTCNSKALRRQECCWRMRHATRKQRAEQNVSCASRQVCRCAACWACPLSCQTFASKRLSIAKTISEAMRCCC